MEREPGLRIALLEQDIVGGGASGRNGGFFSSSWYDLDAIIALFGDAEGLRYAQALADAVAEAARSPPSTASTAGSTPARCSPRGRARGRSPSPGRRAARATARRRPPVRDVDAARGASVRRLAAVRRGGRCRWTTRSASRRGSRAGSAGSCSERGAAIFERTRVTGFEREPTGGRADRARRGARRPGGADDGRVGGRMARVPPELRGDLRLRRRDRTDPRPARARSDGRRSAASSIAGSGSTTCARPTTAGS